MIRYLSFIAGLAVLAACAAPPQQGETSVRYGKVVQIDNVTIDGENQLGVGSIIGAVAGGVIGHQFGGGTGRDVATVAGVLAGGAVGTKAQSKYADRRPAQHIIVQLDNGVAVGVTQATEQGGFNVGDRVRIDGSGNDARVSRM
jgi:outer membrane lipoprotein SlyB